MGRRIIFKRKVTKAISALTYYIESKGLPETAISYTLLVYDFIQKLDNDIISYPKCREPRRASQGLKCVNFQ